ncbi:MAG TPA: hypothetical protein VGP99_13895 [Tepidisphaeraceae bacterium]|jgi:hypothetical protein|nr:hypothetical protein [Tepidisphaeraceae bacterium]
MRAASTLAILFLLGTIGCQQVSLRTWRNSVEHYVWDQANGDPSALRDLPTPGTWKGFSVISENDPASATDVNGLLLAHRQIGSKTYFIYLVGQMRQQQVQDIRLALLRVSPDGFEWRSSRKNNQSLGAYRDFKDNQWHKQFPQRPNGPWSYTGFPGEGDVFKLSISGGSVTATHEQSGAAWTLQLPQDAPTTAPSVASSP